MKVRVFVRWRLRRQLGCAGRSHPSLCRTRPSREGREQHNAVRSTVVRQSGFSGSDVPNVEFKSVGPQFPIEKRHVFLGLLWVGDAGRAPEGSTRRSAPQLSNGAAWMRDAGRAPEGSTRRSAPQLSNGAAWMMSHTFGISRPCTRRRPMSAKPVPIAVCGFLLATSARASVNAAFIPIRG